MRKLLYILLMTVAIVCLNTMADNNGSSNPYGINDRCYAYYFKSLKEHTDLALAYADTVAQIAQSAHDDKALVLSELAKFKHWYLFGLKEEDKLIEAGKKTREIALEKNYLQYYYYVPYQMTVLYINNGKAHMAFKIANDLIKDAKERPHPYGTYVSSMAMANVYYNVRNFAMEYKYLLESLENNRKLSKPQDENIIYSRLASCRATPESERQGYFNKAIKAATTAKDSAAVYYRMIAYCFERKQEDNFHQILKIVKKPKYFNTFDVSRSNEITMQELIVNGNKEEALKYIKSASNNINGILYKRLEGAYFYWEDYKNAYKYRVKYDSVLQKRRQEEYSTNIGRFKATLEYNDLKLQEKEVNTMKYQAEAEKAKADAQKARSEAETREAESNKASAQAKLQIQQDEEKALKLQAEQESKKAQQMLVNAQQAKLKVELQKQKIKEEANKASAGILRLMSLFLILLFLLLIGWYVYLRIQDRKMNKVSKQLGDARLKLAEANKKKDMFIQNMSHEIRTPLNAVMGLSQILTCPGLDVSEEEKKEYSIDIANNTSMLTMLMDDIVNLSQIEQGSYNMNLAPYSIAEVCEAALSVVQYRIPMGVDARFDNQLPEGFECVIDHKRVQQVLTNYLTNACKHTTKGSIIVKATINDNPGHLTLSVTDTGKGVPPEYAEGIFERFTKLNDFVQGTGLGLNICHTIAEKHNGRVRLDTTYTSGARFYFEIPTDLKA